MMDALFLKVVNMSISASWLVLAVVALRFAMKKAPKWMTCALWALVAIRLVCPLSFESIFSLIPESVSSGQVVENISDTYWGDTQILQDGTAGYQAAVDAGREPVSMGNGHYYVVTAQDGISEPPTVANTVVPLLSNVWMIGVIALLVYAAVSYLLIHRKVAPSILLRKNLYLCDYIESPFILGILRPRIYLPSTLDQSQWPHVLAHEQAHLHRKDHWWKPLGFAILCVYWFNPVLWLAYILLCRDIELACDERVIREMDTQQKQDYTTALLECSMPRYLVAACPLAFGEVGVKERVKTVLNYKKPAFWIILVALILCIAVAVCFLTDPVESTQIIPGVYTNVQTVFLQHNPASQSMAGQYILQDNTLYCRNDSGIIAIGTMRPYGMKTHELNSYLPGNGTWNTVLQGYVSDTLWLSLDDGTFYVWFQSDRGETYLASGLEDTAERHTESDDTHITQLCRLSRDKNAEETELVWFDATVLEAQTTLLRVAPVPGSREAEQYGVLEVSRYFFYPDDEMCGMSLLPGEFTEGDRVRIVYDGIVAESYPARINKTYSITNLPALEYVAYNSIEEAILDGCVAMVNGDVVAGQKEWADFVRQTQEGNRVSITTVTYHTIGNPKNMSEELFQEQWDRYPTMYIHTLFFDGNAYHIQWTEDDTVYSQTWKYLMHFTSKAPSPDASFEVLECYMLTDRSDVSYEDLMNGMFSADFNDQIPFKRVYNNYTYDDEPNPAQLEIAKTALEPYMLDYKINYLDANELTHRLDIGVSEWVEGLEELVEQFVDWEFVTVTYQEEGSFVLVERNELYARFPDYFGLSTSKGLELYALEDGYVLMSGTSRNKTEDEINALPRATAAEMREILKSYDPGVVLRLDSIFIYNRTNREEPEIRRELGILQSAEDSIEFSATVLEVNDSSILIEPLPGTVNHPGTDRIWVRRTLAGSGVYVQDMKSGDIVSIRYDGKIAESYPAQINTVYDIQILPEHPDTPKEPLPQWEISLEVTNATATEALIVYHINNLGPGEVWTGYDYHLEVLTEDGWVHYGYPPEELVWESALLFHTTNHYPLDSQNKEIFAADWSRTADAPLPPGTYRYCKGLTVCSDGEFSSISCYGIFEIPEDTPNNPGIHMEILHPTDTGATLAITYNGGLMGELTTQGQYYLMVNVGNDAVTKYGLVPSQVDWDDVLYELNEGETVYIDVRWDHTADAPLPVGTYYVVLIVDQSVSDNGAVFPFQKYITESFAITD